jgi:hypothetical protein
MNCGEDRGSWRGQRGAATLMITVLLLFSLSLVLLYAARVGVTEQRLAANDAQARAAFAAAQAGLDRTLSDLAALDRAAIAYDADGWATVDTRAATLPNDAAYSAEAHNRGLPPFQADVLRLEARGTTGEGGGVRLVTLLAAFSSVLPNIPPAPLMVRGDLSPAGDLTLGSPDRPVAAWIGGVYIPGGATLDAQLSEPASCPPVGICAGDGRIATLTPEAFFENIFGRAPEALRSAAHIIDCASCDPAVVAPEGNVVWLENGGAAVSLTTGQLGTEAHPVIAVIAGDFELAGMLQIYGLLFVLGDWLASGATLSVEGAVVVAGDVVASGPAQLHYHAGILETLQQSGRYSAIPGSWSDF